MDGQQLARALDRIVALGYGIVKDNDDDSRSYAALTQSES
jgi:hypothetical protein